jgi:PKD repeat protein
MKRIIYLFLAMPLFLISCQKAPQASFSADPANPEVGQIVYFNNDSRNAESFEWDFGDGTSSSARNPTHIFTGTGPVVVKLSAFSKNNIEDKASLSLDVLIPTLLEIEVLEYYQETAVANASIFLYPTIIDWDNQTNVEAQGYTDADGIAVFANLGPFVYYVDVYAKNYDNYALRKDDIGFVRTSEVLPHKINRFLAYVDYVTHTKGDGRVVREAVIKKLERKAADRPQSETNLGTEGWQELYKRSVKLK